MCGPQQYIKEANIQKRKFMYKFQIYKYLGNSKTYKDFEIYIYIHTYIYIYYYCFYFILFCFNLFGGFRKYVFLLILVQAKGWDGLYRKEETKLVCAISRKLIFG